VARVQEPQRLLTLGAGLGATLATRLAADPRRVMLVLLVAGLAASISLSQAMLAVVAVWLLRERLHDRLAVSWPLAAPLLAFGAWTLATALWSAAPLESLGAARSVTMLATLWIVLHVLADAARARWFATALFVAVSVVAALAIVQVATCGGERLYGKALALPSVLSSFFGKCQRAHGFYSIYMTLAGVLAMVLSLTLPRLLDLRHRVASIAGWLAGAVAFALTLVRGAWMGFGAGVLVLACTVRRRGLLLAAVGVAAALVLAVPGVWQRAATLVDASDPTARERLAMLSAGLALVTEHPVAGIGPGQVRRLYPEYAPPHAVRRHTSHLHNTPLQIAVERGLVGLALWLWIFAAFFARTIAIWRGLPADATRDRALVAGSAAAIAAFVAGGLFEYNFGDTEVLLVAMSVMALPFVLERDRARRAA
jgi:putative inorganic carbon (HCO3(-)) transporter